MDKELIIKKLTEIFGERKEKKDFGLGGIVGGEGGDWEWKVKKVKLNLRHMYHKREKGQYDPEEDKANLK